MPKTPPGAPILVYGAAGAGASMLIWTIKKILYPDYHIDDPVDSRGSAHQQPLLPHWFGQETMFNHILSTSPERERIIHCEPNQASCEWQKLQDYPSFFIYFENLLDVEQACKLARAKIPMYKDYSYDELLATVNQPGGWAWKAKDTSMPIPFKQLMQGPLNELLNSIAGHLKVTEIAEWSTLTTVHNKWRSINSKILNENTMPRE